MCLIDRRACPGHRNRNYAVTLSEVLTVIAVALGEAPCNRRSAFHHNGDGHAPVAEILRGATALRESCPGG